MQPEVREVQFLALAERDWNFSFSSAVVAEANSAFTVVATVGTSTVGLAAVASVCAEARGPHIGRIVVAPRGWTIIAGPSDDDVSGDNANPWGIMVPRT